MEREQTWIRAIQRRNSREAAEQLIQTYYDEIYRFVYRQTGSKEDAMDLTQSVFIAVLRALPGYRAERASFRTCLYRIAANKDVYKRQESRCWKDGRSHPLRRVPSADRQSTARRTASSRLSQ